MAPLIGVAGLAASLGGLIGRRWGRHDDTPDHDKPKITKTMKKTAKKAKKKAKKKLRKAAQPVTH